MISNYANHVTVICADMVPKKKHLDQIQIVWGSSLLRTFLLNMHLSERDYSSWQTNLQACEKRIERSILIPAVATGTWAHVIYFPRQLIIAIFQFRVVSWKGCISPTFFFVEIAYLRDLIGNHERSARLDINSTNRTAAVLIVSRHFEGLVLCEPRH